MTHPPKSHNEEDIEQLPDPDQELPQLKIFTQTRIFYWWPVWALGFIMAFLSFLSGNKVDQGNFNDFVHPSASPGVIFVIVLFMVIIFTNFSFRGAASFGVAAIAIIVSLSLALFDWWDNVFKSFSYLSIYMNMGFYLFFSTLLFLLWCYATFIHVRFHYYRIRPGQISELELIGEGETNYDSRGAVLEKYREDFFRHWILGFGSGDIKISTTGARSKEIRIKDVLMVDRKISKIRRLMSVQPDDLLHEPHGD